MPALQNSMWEAMMALVESGFTKTPALMVGLAALAGVPLLVALGAVIVKMARHAVRDDTSVAGPVDGPTEAWRAGPASAALRRGEMTAGRISAGSPLVRIGRHDDNDICIESETAHRYHAIVHRGDDGRFWLVDLSGDDGNGVRVNGERVQRRRLRGGDIIEIGGETLTFAVEGRVAV